MEKKLGKIESVSLGFGGYQGAMFGFTIDLSMNGNHVSDFLGTWSKRYGDEKWTEKDQNDTFIAAFLKIKNIMSDAKKNDFTKLVGVPVEVTLENNSLKSWRVLTEVI